MGLFSAADPMEISNPLPTEGLVINYNSSTSGNLKGKSSATLVMTRCLVPRGRNKIAAAL